MDVPSDRQVGEALEDLETWVRGGYPPQRAREKLRQMYRDPELVERAVEEHRRRSRRFIDFTDPRVLKGQEHIETWYQGPDFPGAWCWPSYEALLQKKGWKPSAIQSVDTASTKIMAHLPHPGEGRIATRGLVVGHVQSGKTANYTGLIAKAADAGYKLFVVMTGMTSSLRQQTQRRLQAELCRPNSENWNALTSPSQDFQGVGNPDYMLTPQNQRGRILCIVKKNVFILKRLIDFFALANPDVKSDCPVIIIDDEADQASVNTRRKANERSAINQKIVELLDTLPKSVYIGYTATPFANIFIDPSLPEDLYPRDFIFDLPRPDEYFGAERIFGREMLRHDEDDEEHDGLDMIRDVPHADVACLQPPGRAARFEFEPEMAPSLERAIRYFLLASACRLARGQGEEHSSMLIHTTLYTHTHQQLQSLVAEYLGVLADGWGKREQLLRDDLQALWSEEQARVSPADLGVTIDRIDFDGLQPRLAEVFDRCRVVVDNGQMEEGLSYSDHEPAVQVAIGGNTLSRGLTLEGLLVSYFIRTASAYDTLLQMGRWFGYRQGYEDLPRVWITPELQDHFIHLSTVEAEIRHDIRRYEQEGRTPMDFAVRVQTHPKLAFTSRLKMQNVSLASASYGDSHIQTFQFKHDDAVWLRNNFEAVRHLMSAVTDDGKPEECSGARWLFRGVPTHMVTSFLEQYEAVQEDFADRLLLEYIRSEQEHGGLKDWNIGLIGSKRMSEVDLGIDPSTRLVRRSRYRRVQPANIKALTSRADRIIDLDWEGDLENLTSVTMSAIRNDQAADTGLLLIYPIDRESRPTGESRERHPLDAKEHVIGVGLSFPRSKRPTSDYLQNNLEGLDDAFSGAGMEEERPEEEDVIRIAEEEAEQEG